MSKAATMEIPINSNGDTGTLPEDDSLEQVGQVGSWICWCETFWHQPVLFTHLKLFGLHLETRCITSWQKNINIPKSKLQLKEGRTENTEFFNFLLISFTLWNHFDHFYCIKEKLWFWKDIVDPLKTSISFKHMFLVILLCVFSLKEFLTIALTSCIQRCIQWNCTIPKGCIIHVKSTWRKSNRHTCAELMSSRGISGDRWCGVSVVWSWHSGHGYSSQPSRD